MEQYYNYFLPMKKSAQTVVPLALLLSGAEAAKVDNQAHIQELSSLVQQALSETETVSTSDAEATSQINSQIQNTVNEAIESETE